MIIGMPTTSFPRHEGDPSGAFVLGMARALARRGHEIEVLAPEAEGALGWDRPLPGVRVAWIPYARPRSLQRTFHRAGAPENLARDPLAWIGAASFPIALARAIDRRAGRWDAAASHWGVPCGWITARAIGRRAPHVAFFHSGDVHAIARLPTALGRTIAREVAGGSSALAFASRALRDRFSSFAEVDAPAHVMPMGIDPIDVIDRARARGAIGAGAFLLLAMSRLVPVKGLDRAIDAIAGLPGIELAVAGEGPERARLEARARERGVRARFLGAIAGTEKARWMNAADALIAPSIVLPSGRTEGTPTAVIEAMHAGVPVIASDAGGLPDLVGDGVGGMIAKGAEIDRLRASIACVAADPALRARLAIGARMRARGATWDAIAPRIEQMLAQEGPPARRACSA